MGTNGAGGTIIIAVGARKTGPSACAVRARVTLTLRDAKTRRPLRVNGNPHRHLIRDRGFMLQWSNYCGAPRPVMFELALGARHVRERRHLPGARCESAAVPSTLRVFRIRR
jgi:hypothetical protein